MYRPHRSGASIRVLVSYLAAVALAACIPGETGNSGSGGNAGTTAGNAGTTGVGGMAGSSALGEGGNTGAAGISGPGDAGTTGAAGTTGSAGIGGAAGTSSGAGTTGTAGTGAGGASGVTGTSGRGGRGGSAGGTAGASGRGGAAGGSTAGTTGSGGTRGECTPPASYANLFVTVSGHTQAESDAKVSQAWSSLFNPSGSGTVYFNGPGSNESYVQDIYNNDVRSEGMSYGMMVAVQLDHQTEFDRLWTWVKTHMAQGTTSEIRWRCQTSGSGCAGGGAPDGEEYFATALIFASHRWGDSTGPAKIAYSTEAKWVLDVIRTKYFNSQYHLVKFVSSSNNVDPSYVLPAFYEVWACFDTANADFWQESATAGRAYMQKVVDSNGVCPYQASFTATNPQAANADSTRCVVNLMMDWYLFGKDPWQRDTYAPKFAAYSSSRNNGAPAVGCNSTLGFGLPSSSGKAFVDKLWSTAVPSRDYWGGVLYMLGMVHVSGNFRIW